MTRTFRDGHIKTWFAADARLRSWDRMASPAWCWRPPPRPPCHPRPSGTRPPNLPRPPARPAAALARRRGTAVGTQRRRKGHMHRRATSVAIPASGDPGGASLAFPLDPASLGLRCNARSQHAPATASPHGLRRRRLWPATPTSITIKRSLTNGSARALQPPPVVYPNCWTAPASRLLSAPAGGGQRSQSGADQELCVDCNEGGVMIVTRQYSRQLGGRP